MRRLHPSSAFVPSKENSILVEPPVQDPVAEAAEKKAVDKQRQFYLNKGRLRYAI